jgi:hypothetical protein
VTDCLPFRKTLVIIDGNYVNWLLGGLLRTRFTTSPWKVHTLLPLTMFIFSVLIIRGCHAKVKSPFAGIQAGAVAVVTVVTICRSSIILQSQAVRGSVEGTPVSPRWPATRLVWAKDERPKMLFYVLCSLKNLDFLCQVLWFWTGFVSLVNLVLTCSVLMLLNTVLIWS